MSRRLLILILLPLWMGVTTTWGAQRFPPPDFESGYELPVMQNPAARSLPWQYIDVGVLLLTLSVASYIVLKHRSRKWIIGISVFSLLYFGFYREGCVCAIGSVQNVALALFDSGYAVPLTVLVFFAAPLLATLLFGRTFCAAVCPQGALQDLVLWKPVNVPRRLDQALSLIPYIFLGVGLLLAATGSTFLICRWDPLVPIFRLSGGSTILAAGLFFLVVGMFVGRPYCRYVCPYGVLLRLASKVSRWQVRITPDECTQCRLCESSCPYGAIREPAAPDLRPLDLARERRRFVFLLLAMPVLIGLCGWLGHAFSSAAAGTHPDVALAQLYLDQQSASADEEVADKPQPELTAVEVLALSRAERTSPELLARAVDIRRRFEWGGWILGAWIGLVIGAKLTRPSILPRRKDFEPDRGSCFGCARCFIDCPQERVRLGLPVEEPVVPPAEALSKGVPKTPSAAPSSTPPSP